METEIPLLNRNFHVDKGPFYFSSFILKNTDRKGRRASVWIQTNILEFILTLYYVIFHRNYTMD